MLLFHQNRWHGGKTRHQASYQPCYFRDASFLWKMAAPMTGLENIIQHLMHPMKAKKCERNGLLCIWEKWENASVRLWHIIFCPRLYKMILDPNLCSLIEPHSRPWQVKNHIMLQGQVITCSTNLCLWNVERTWSSRRKGLIRRQHTD